MAVPQVTSPAGTDPITVVDAFTVELTTPIAATGAGDSQYGLRGGKARITRASATGANGTLQGGRRVLASSSTLPADGSVFCLSTYFQTLNGVRAVSSTQGAKLVLFSSDNDWKSFIYSGGNHFAALVRFSAVVHPSASSHNASGGTLANSITALELLIDRNGTQAYEQVFTSFDIVAPLTITRGDSTTPANFRGFMTYASFSLSNASDSGKLIVYRQQNQVWTLVSLQIGGGTAIAQSTYFLAEGTSVAFSANPDYVTPDPLSHLPDEIVGLSIKPRSGDTIIIRSCQINSNKKWRFDSTAATGATVLFDGTQLYNAGTMTLNAPQQYSACLFYQCGTINANGATINNGTAIRQSTANAIAITTSTVGDCVISGCQGSAIVISAAGDYRNFVATVRDSVNYDVLITDAVTTGTIDLSSLTFASGSTTPINIRWLGTSGSITVIVGQSGVTTSTAGGTINLQSPVVALNAPNFAENTRVQVQRVEQYTVAATDVNTSTDQITVTGNQFTAATFPTLVVILKGTGTLPTSTPQVIDRGLYYVVAKSGDTIQISKTQNGTPIDFTAQGSSSFTIVGYTELANGLAGSSGYSTTLSESDGTLLQVKARHWAEAAGVASASTFFQSTYVWSATSGITIADSVSIANSPDTVHNAIAAAANIVLPDGSTIAPVDSGATVTGFSFEADGLVKINVTNGRFLIQDAYLWFVYASATESGIRLTNNFNFRAEDLFNYVLQDVQLESISTVPVYSVGGYVRSANSLSLVSNQSNPLHLNSDQKGVAITVNSGSGLSSEQSTQLSNLAATLASSGVFSTAALVNAPTGGTADWTTTEKNQIRYRLGIDGTTGTPSASPTLPVSVASISNNAITASAIATDAITAAKLAPDVTTEIQTGLLLAADYTAPNNSGITTLLSRLTETRAGYLDAAISSRLSSSAYTAPDNSGIASIQNVLTAIQGTGFDSSTHSLVSIRNRGDSNWATATGFSTFNPTTDQVIVATNNDKTGYSLSTAPPTAQQIWEYSTRTITDKTGFSLTQPFPANFANLGINTNGDILRVVDVTNSTNLDAATIRSAVGLATNNLDAQLSGINTNIGAIPTTPLLAADYTAPNNSGINTLLSRLTETRAGYLDAAISGIPATVWGYTGTIATNVLNQVRVDVSLLAKEATLNAGIASINTAISDNSKITELWQVHGLDNQNPVTASVTGRTVGTIVQTVTTNGDNSKTMRRE